MERRAVERKKDHLFDTKNIISTLLTRYGGSSDYIRKKINAADKVINLLANFKEILQPTFLDYQLTQAIADAAHFVSVDIGSRVVFSKNVEKSNSTDTDVTMSDREVASEHPNAPIFHEGGPSQFSQPGCEIACTILSLIFSLLYLDNVNIPFGEFVGTIEWPAVMSQARLLFKAWRRTCDEKLRQGKIKTLPPYPTMDEIWFMPNLKRATASYVTIDKSGFYKTEWTDEDGRASAEFIPFKERLRRVDAAVRQRKIVLVHVVTSISLTICILSIYNPMTNNVSYVIYDPHGTFLLRRESAHYALNFRNDDTDQKAFMAEYPSLECLMEHSSEIPFFALQEARTEPTKYTIATIAREAFEY